MVFGYGIPASQYHLDLPAGGSGYISHFLCFVFKICHKIQRFRISQWKHMNGEILHKIEN
jgi:hypothetical protein